jgi:hypothetical protein
MAETSPDMLQRGILRMLDVGCWTVEVLVALLPGWTTPLLRSAAADEVKGRVCRHSDETGGGFNPRVCGLGV